MAHFGTRELNEILITGFVKIKNENTSKKSFNSHFVIIRVYHTMYDSLYMVHGTWH